MNTPSVLGTPRQVHSTLPYKYVWCGTCATRQTYSVRPNNDDCADVCCDVCHYVIATVFKG